MGNDFKYFTFDLLRRVLVNRCHFNAMFKQYTEGDILCDWLDGNFWMLPSKGESVVMIKSKEYCVLFDCCVNKLRVQSVSSP